MAAEEVVLVAEEQSRGCSLLLPAQGHALLAVAVAVQREPTVQNCPYRQVLRQV